MPWIMQMLWFALMCIGIAFAVWVSFWVLLVIFGLGILAVIWSHLRDFLLEKGVLNPTPGIPPSDADGEGSAPPPTVIEGDYTRVDSE